jgi:hypothetical protein
MHSVEKDFKVRRIFYKQLDLGLIKKYFKVKNTLLCA